jgi:hypothetical protein
MMPLVVLSLVMLVSGLDPGIDPRIHRKRSRSFVKAMDCRVKPGNDGGATVK